MAGIFSKFTNKVRSVFRAKPIPPKLTPQQKIEQRYESLGGTAGNRGIAARSLKEGEQDFSAENVAKWTTLTHEQGIGFVFNQEIFFVHSSNVAAFQYHLNEQKMMVEYLDGSAYLYSNVPESVAVAAFNAQSKGGFIWSYFRIRGTKTGHRVPYVKIKSGTRKGRKKTKNT